MCGLTGIFTSNTFESGQMAATAQAMAERIAYRYQDDFGVWADAEMGIALDRWRLSILDLSPAGHHLCLLKTDVKRSS